MIKVKLLTQSAKCPTKGSTGAAGYDVYSDHGANIYHGNIKCISTGIAVKIPDGYVGLIKPRSGLAFNHGIDTLAGVIDSDYRGEIKVMLTTHNEGGVTRVQPNERIAQLLIMPVENKHEFTVVEYFNDDTERGDNGFGSTGLK